MPGVLCSVMTPTQDAIDEAIDSAYLCGQIDALSMFLVPNYNPQAMVLENLLVPGAFENRRNELLWTFSCWCFALNCAMVAGR